MLHDYTACKRSLECLFGLGDLGKLNLSAGSLRQSSSASLLGGDWVSELLAVIDIRLYGAALKRDTSFWGKYQGSAMETLQSAAH
ncbi:hypothetical protein TNCV_5027741 [Trichonephila clavipes]|nr:hypothetical protein TNCV_5027741 [Trichonephila clavipes]